MELQPQNCHDAKSVGCHRANIHEFGYADEIPFLTPIRSELNVLIEMSETYADEYV